MKTTRNPMLIVLTLAVVILMVAGIEACANTMKAPKGRLVSYDFRVGGGMNPFDQTVYYLRYEGANKVPTLTVSGDCQGEVITFEVPAETFDRCAQLAEKHKLYRSKGFYESHIQVLDAPSASFSLHYDGDGEWYSGSGDWPKFVSEGVSAINTYLRSLVGDRKAPGHVDRIYGGDDLPGMCWTDGISSATTTDSDAKELKLLARRLAIANKIPGRNVEKLEDGDISGMGYSRFHDGDQHYIVIHDYTFSQHRLFYSYDGKPESMKRMVDEQVKAIRAAKVNDKGRYDIVNERFLSHPMIQQLKPDQVEKMLKDIRVEPLSEHSSMVRYPDIGEVNRDLLQSELKRLGKSDE